MKTSSPKDDLSSRDAARIVRKLQRVLSQPEALLREILLDLPPADIDVLRGLARIGEKRSQDARAV